MIQYEHGESVPDPDGVEVRNAATVMILRDDPDLQVLMVQRTSRAAFGPRAWVFPGGRVDADDAAALDPSLDGSPSRPVVASGLDDVTASAMLDIPSGGLAWWLAGVRETLEEAGLLLGVDGADGGAIDRARAAVHEDADALVAALEANGLVVDLSCLHEVARFITPVGPPRRFDTRFFVALAPADQVAHHDEDEVVEHMWIRPAEAIDRWRGGDLELMAVTHRMLACLKRYEMAAEAVAAGSQRRPAQRVRVNDPDGRYEVLLPGEPGYDTADIEIEHGVVRF